MIRCLSSLVRAGLAALGLALVVMAALPDAVGDTASAAPKAERCSGRQLGGYCPRLARSCLRQAKDPAKDCPPYTAQCERCNAAFVACRDAAGPPGSRTCNACIAALDRCRAELADTARKIPRKGRP